MAADKGISRRWGVVLPAAAIAAVMVGAVSLTAYLVSPDGSGARSLSQAVDALPATGSVAALEQEERQIKAMDAATAVLTADSAPVVVSPSQMQAASGDSSSATATATAPPPPPDPGTAQHIAYEMLPRYGFSQSTQWSCLDNLWQHESGWSYDAENTSSGAYGIPQSLPASKMGVFGSDYLTDPTTQIKWGLWYISTTYGSPCTAYNFDLANGGYLSFRDPRLEGSAAPQE